MRIKLDSIEVRYNPRSVFDMPKEFIQSIKEVGLLQPLTVCENGSDKYVLVDGERRLRAIKKLGWEEVDVYVKKMSEHEQRQVPIITDLMKDLLLLGDKASGIHLLVDKEKKYSDKSISKALGLTLKKAQRLVRIGRLHPSIIEHINKGKIDEYEADKLTKVKNEVAQIRLAKAMSEDDLTFSQALDRVMYLIDFDDMVLYERIKGDNKLGIFFKDDYDDEYVYCYDEKMYKESKEAYEEKEKKKYAKKEKEVQKQKELNLQAEGKTKEQRKKDRKKLQAKQADMYEIFHNALPKYLTQKAQAYEIGQLVTKYSLRIPTDVCKMMLKAWKVEFKAKDMCADDYKKEVAKIISQYVKTETELPKLILFVTICQNSMGDKFTLYDMGGLKKIINKLDVK